MVLHAIVDGGRLRPRLACPPLEVPTRGQGAHIWAARSWHRASGGGPPPHRSASLPRDASGSVEAVRSGMVLALLSGHGCTGAQPPPVELRYARRPRIAHGGTRCAWHDEREEVSTVPPTTPQAVPAHRVLRTRQPPYPRGRILGQGGMICRL